MRSQLLIWLCVPVLILAAYTVVVHSRHAEGRWQWWGTMLGTSASVLLAFVFGLLLHDIDVRDQTELAHARHRQALRTELLRVRRKFANLNHMTLGLGSPGKTVQLPISYIHPEPLLQVAMSDLLPEDLQDGVFKLADDIGTYNLTAGFALTAIASADPSAAHFEELGRYMAKQLRQQKQDIELQCGEVLSSDFWDVGGNP